MPFITDGLKDDFKGPRSDGCKKFTDLLSVAIVAVPIAVASGGIRCWFPNSNSELDTQLKVCSHNTPGRCGLFSS